jgi:hypothetical protein
MILSEHSTRIKIAGAFAYAANTFQTLPALFLQNCGFSFKMNSKSSPGSAFLLQHGFNVKINCITPFFVGGSR